MDQPETEPAQDYGTWKQESRAIQVELDKVCREKLLIYSEFLLSTKPSGCLRCIPCCNMLLRNTVMVSICFDSQLLRIICVSTMWMVSCFEDGEYVSSRSITLLCRKPFATNLAFLLSMVFLVLSFVRYCLWLACLWEREPAQKNILINQQLHLLHHRMSPIIPVFT